MNGFFGHDYETSHAQISHCSQWLIMETRKMVSKIHETNMHFRIHIEKNSNPGNHGIRNSVMLTLFKHLQNVKYC